MYSIFLSQLFLVFLSSFICYIIGKSVISLYNVKGDFFSRLFKTYIIGIVIIVLFYSIIKAQGRTVNILLLPFIAYLIYYFRKSINPKIHICWLEIKEEMTWSIIVFSVIFLYQSYFYFDFWNGHIKPLFGDYFWYAGIGNNLQSSGAENNLLNCNYFFHVFTQSIKPYHYFELWFSAFFSFITQKSLIIPYYFSTFSIFTASFIFGISSLLEKTFRNKALLIIISLILCFITDVTFPSNFNTSNSLGIMAINGQKAAFIFCFILFSFIIIKQGNWFIGLCLLAIIPIFSVTYLPGIWGGLFLFSIIQIAYHPTSPENKKYGLLIFHIALLAVLFVFLYSTNNEKTNSSEFLRIFEDGIFKGFNGELTIVNIKRIGANFISYTIPNIILHGGTRLLLYIPFIIILIQSAYKNRKLLFLLCLILIAGAFTTSLSKSILNSDQFTSLLGILFIVYIIFLYTECISSSISKSRKILVSVGIGILIIISWISPYNSRANYDNDEDIVFIQKASDVLYENNETVIMSFFTKDDARNNAYYLWIYANTIMPISQLNNTPIVFSIGNPEIFLETGKMSYYDSIAYYKNTALNIWRQKGKQYNLENFIERFKVKYFYIKKNAVTPDFIQKNAILVIESPITKSKFIKIR